MAVAAAGLAAIPMAAYAQLINLTYGEVKLGVLAHDVSFFGGREKGIDINPEVILPSPINDAWVATLPAYLRWMVQPRPAIGAEINTSGYTNQLYFGANWDWQIFGNVFRPGDAITASIFFGGAANDGQIISKGPDRKSLGSHLLFREALEIGYQITPAISISVMVDHVSNAGFARQNQSINDFGGRLGFRF